jgi:2-dehydropantoate 2-reductase
MDKPKAKDNSILIAGTGAMACLFAARLSAAGFQVGMLGEWSAGLDALQRRGVILAGSSSAGGAAETRHAMRASSDPKDFAGARLALVLVKSYQTQRTAQMLKACLHKQGLALTLQNGLGNREILSETLGAGRVALGVTTAGATLLEPGRVRSGGEGVTTLGDHARLAPLVKALSCSGFSVEQDPDPDALLWGKLVINAAINPLTALLNVPNGELLRRSTARLLMASLAREAAAVAIAQGLRLRYPDAVAQAEQVAERTASNRSSMLQDISRGRRTEIDAICGAIARAGEQAGQPAPLNQAMYLLVKAME